MRRPGKKYVEASKKVDKAKAYSATEAIKLVKETNTTKFDSSIDLVIHLNVDASKSDQQLRGSIVLPAGTGKVQKILVLADGEDAKKAIAAGADFVGAEDMIEKIEKENWFGFDIIVATPKMMPKLGKLGKVLGPKGLMPNPKTNTVTNNPEKVILDIKKGMLGYKTDTYGNVHTIIGKVSFKEKDLVDNLNYYVKTITNLKPTSVKGDFVKSISISSTMGPGIKVDKNSFDI
jgi:large subunit ribosomal protein L1